MHERIEQLLIETQCRTNIGRIKLSNQWRLLLPFVTIPVTISIPAAVAGPAAISCCYRLFEIFPTGRMCLPIKSIHICLYA